jgi:hypothetical protein
MYSHEHPGRFDENGIPYVSRIPEDLYRNYDEATYRVFDRRIKAGHPIPRATADGGMKGCVTNSFFGYILGFTFGLQYDPQNPSACYANIQTTIIAIDTILASFILILLPTKWADVSLSFQDFLTLVGTLYGNC